MMKIRGFGVASLDVWLRMRVLGEDGKIEERWHKCHSFVKNGYSLLNTALANDIAGKPQFDVVDVDGTSRTVSWDEQNDANKYGANAPANNDDYGLIVGTNGTGTSWSDYNLRAKINHGTGSGELVYHETEIKSSEDSGAPAKITLERKFDNDSGGSITVREVGWFIMVTVGGSQYYVMMLRDTPAATTVGDGARLISTYYVYVNPP
ncbi:MAG: hypothetical protein DRH44_07465 [Candidatus Coatesbacteria bacterium]|nr:MAG: hypothetical protein DRH44_07465 [Candidatus Coatesbacteria bacterium]RLC42930.1 MAG: hypothetical protein DRH49_02655 [Candidatus Coatesbacteria bacterium]